MIKSHLGITVRIPAVQLAEWEDQLTEAVRGKDERIGEAFRSLPSEGRRLRDHGQGGLGIQIRWHRGRPASRPRGEQSGSGTGQIFGA